MDEFLRFERVEFERIVGERHFKKRKPYDAYQQQNFYHVIKNNFFHKIYIYFDNL